MLLIKIVKLLLPLGHLGCSNRELFDLFHRFVQECSRSQPFHLVLTTSDRNVISKHPPESFQEYNLI
jgi:hypothetical protein